ncbi:MAG: photosystem II reaction center protein T, partial [Vulcanococcus sp.]
MESFAYILILALAIS